MILRKIESAEIRLYQSPKTAEDEDDDEHEKDFGET
jgi:hypothetical protein